MHESLQLTTTCGFHFLFIYKLHGTPLSRTAMIPDWGIPEAIVFMRVQDKIRRITETKSDRHEL